MKVILFGLLVVFFSGCAVVYTPLMATHFNDITVPKSLDISEGGLKVGTSQSENFFGLVVIGDASIQAAKKEAGITNISHVDMRAWSFLSIYATYTTVVYGE